MAQGYTYNYNYKKIALRINFHKHLIRLNTTLTWGLDGCARWRKVTITVTIKSNWKVVFQRIYDVLNNIWLGLGWMRAVAQCYNYSCNKIELDSNFQKNLRF